MAENKFWLEVEMEILLEKAEQDKAYIIETIPHSEIYTLSGEINPNTRWGATLWAINNMIATLNNMGF